MRAPLRARNVPARALLPVLLAGPALAASPQDGVLVDADKVPAPSTVEIDGGRTTVGTKVKDLEELFDEDEVLQSFVRPLDAETPQHKVHVATFRLGITEVTNEQYAEFVRATGHRPPFSWGEEALADAARAFAEAEFHKFEEAKARGERYERKKFDDVKEQWWSENWRESDWQIPAGGELQPVTYVDYSDVLAYCDWAGVRPMTEFEYQRACRKDSDSKFPWGDEWEIAKFANTSEGRKSFTFPAGSFPDGTSPYGVHDLAGNVWEWTSSPYVAYEDHENHEYDTKKDGKRVTLEPIALWDPNQRVVVGGSFQSPWLAARCTTRRATDRTQLTNGVGFRVAASTKVGVDKAQAIWDGVVRNAAARAGGAVFLPDQAVAIDRWTSREGSEGAPEGYAVITGYEYVLFAPLERLELGSDTEFARATLESPIQLGFFSTSIAMKEPDLVPGTYIVAFRAKGDPPRADEEEGAEDDDIGEGGGPNARQEQDPALLTPEQRMLQQIDLGKDNLLFLYANTGELAAAVETKSPSFGRGTPGGEYTYREEKIWVGTGSDKVQELQRWLDLEVRVALKVRNRVLPVEMQFLPADDALTRSWRAER